MRNDTETKEKIMNQLVMKECINNKMLQITYDSIYKPLNLNFSSFPKEDPESKDYAGYNFSIANKNFKFRVAKTTPTKLGHFVTL